MDFKMDNYWFVGLVVAMVMLPLETYVFIHKFGYLLLFSVISHSLIVCTLFNNSIRTQFVGRVKSYIDKLRFWLSK